jgi:hypothetical protein
MMRMMRILVEVTLSEQYVGNGKRNINENPRR